MWPLGHLAKLGKKGSQDTHSTLLVCTRLLKVGKQMGNAEKWKHLWFSKILLLKKRRRTFKRSAFPKNYIIKVKKVQIENWDGLEQVLARPIFDILSTPFAHNLQVLFYKSVQRNCLQTEFFNYKKFSDCYHSIYDSYNFGPQKSIWQWTKRSMAHLFFHAPCIFDKVLPLDWLLGFSV